MMASLKKAARTISRASRCFDASAALKYCGEVKWFDGGRGSPGRKG